MKTEDKFTTAGLIIVSYISFSKIMLILNEKVDCLVVGIRDAGTRTQLGEGEEKAWSTNTHSSLLVYECTRYVNSRVQDIYKPGEKTS